MVNIFVGAELDCSRYGLEAGQVSSLTESLTRQYCGTTALECGYLEDLEEMQWLCDTYQQIKDQPVDDAVRKSLAAEMLKSQAFDNFLATKFQSVKRYGGEGAEAMMGFFVQLFSQSQDQGLSDIVIAEVGPYHAFSAGNIN